MNGQFIYMLASVRSGSTLLSQLLGAHSEIVVAGELTWLRAYALNDRRLFNPPYELVCACGSTFAECEFWRAIDEIVERPLADLDLQLRGHGWRGPGEMRRSMSDIAARRIIRMYPGIYRSRLVQRFYGGLRAATNSVEIYEAILEHTNARYVVDSSKGVFRCRSIFESYPQKLKAIFLQRDYRAVVYSQLKRGISLEDSARHWAHVANQIELFSKDIPAESIIRLKYEDLCEHPIRELERLCKFLDLNFEENMLSRPTEGIHDIGGSPSKFQPGRQQIRLDAEFRDAFTNSQLDTMRRLVGSAAESQRYT